MILPTHAIVLPLLDVFRTPFGYFYLNTGQPPKIRIATLSIITILEIFTASQTTIVSQLADEREMLTPSPWGEGRDEGDHVQRKQVQAPIASK